MSLYGYQIDRLMSSFPAIFRPIYFDFMIYREVVFQNSQNGEKNQKWANFSYHVAIT